MGMAIDELYAVLGWKVEGEANLKRYQAGLKRVESQIDAFVTRAGAFAVALGTVAAGAAAAFGKSVISTSAQFEKLEATLTTIEGSSDKAKKALNWVSDFATKTPFDLQQVSEAFVRLRAYGLDPTTGLLESLGDASSAMGKDLMSAVEMIADASTGEFERMKEFGITTKQAGDQVVFSWTENGKSLSKTVKKSGEDITKFIQERFGARFSGAMLRQSKTWDGMVGNLGDSWERFKLRVGQGGFFDTVKGHLGDLLDYIGRLDKDGTLDRWSKSLSTGLTWAVNKAKGNIEDLKFVFEGIAGWFKANPDWHGPILTGLMALGAYIFPKTFALLVLEDILKWMQGKGSIITELAQSIEELTGIDAASVDNVLAAIAAGGAGLLIAVGPTKAMAVAIRGLATALGLMSGSAAVKGLGFFGALGGALKGAAGALARHPLLVAGAVTYGALNDVPHDAMASATKDDPELLARLAAERQRWGGTHFEGGRHRAGLDAGPKEGGLDALLDNYRNNTARIGRDAAAATVINDSSDRSINVKATATVSVAEINQAAAAAGRETESAVRSALSSKPRLNRGMF